MGKGNPTKRPLRLSSTPPDPALIESMRVRSIERLAREFRIQLPADAGKDKIDALRGKKRRRKTP